MASGEASSTESELRKRLRVSDQLFDAHFPDDGRIGELPRKRLRQAILELGISRGDKTRDTFVKNLNEHARHRLALVREYGVF